VPGWLNFFIVLTLVVGLLAWQSLGDALLIAFTTFVFIGTVLRMWDSVSEADAAGEFAPRYSRTPQDEFRRLFAYFTTLDRGEHASTSDRELYYLRTAQSWFFLSVGAVGALLFAIGHVISS
jgi:hypothetical protein